MQQVEKCSKDAEEYDTLWMKTKQYSTLVDALYRQQSIPAPKPAPAAPAKEQPKTEKK